MRRTNYFREWVGGMAQSRSDPSTALGRKPLWPRLRDAIEVEGYWAAISRVYGTRVFTLPLRHIGNRGCLFTFHRVAEATAWEELPNRPFYLDSVFLRQIICHLLETGWSVVTMDEVVDRLRCRQPGKFVNFSIDDGYRDTWALAAPIFAEFGAPVTVYVTTGIPDCTYSMWTSGLEQIIKDRDRLALQGQDAAPQWVVAGSAREKSHLYRAVARAWERADPEQAYRRFCAMNGYDTAQLQRRHAISWDMLRALRDDPFTEIGAHTISHPRLSSVSDADALSELAGSRSRLGEKLGVEVRHMAFPFGRAADCSARDGQLARRAGYSSASTTRRSLIWPEEPADLYALPRINLNGAMRHIGQVTAHLTGLSSVLAKMTGRI
jgi:peptidoglycan/xylan/chitin deacetylase (PgdA/CDA1 family)